MADLEYLRSNSDEILHESPRITGRVVQPEARAERISDGNRATHIPFYSSYDSDIEIEFDVVMENQRQPSQQLIRRRSDGHRVTQIVLSDNSDIEIEYMQMGEQQTGPGSDGNTVAPIILEDDSDIESEVDDVVEIIPIRRQNNGNYARRRNLDIAPDHPIVRAGADAAERNATGSTTDQQLTPELSVSKEIVESFGLDGLLESQEDEITDIEEMSFQKVLRKKMVCDVCMNHMKLYRCRKCMYSMCQKCNYNIKRFRPGNAICPQCRESQQNFMQIVLPRL